MEPVFYFSADHSCKLVYLLFVSFHNVCTIMIKRNTKVIFKHLCRYDQMNHQEKDDDNLVLSFNHDHVPPDLPKPLGCRV